MPGSRDCSANRSEASQHQLGADRLRFHRSIPGRPPWARPSDGAMTVSGGGFNRAMQHTDRCMSSGSVADGAEKGSVSVFEAGSAGAWDVAILAIDRVRAPPLVVLEGTYVTREPSPCSTVLDLDRVGMRISIVRDTVFDAHLTDSLRHAELIRSPTFQGAVDRFLAERLDAVAGLKQQMAAFVEVNAGLRVMEGRFMAIEPAFAVPKGRSAGLRYLKMFVEELKASRRLADALRCA